jgi:hypothetical protein
MRSDFEIVLSERDEDLLLGKGRMTKAGQARRASAGKAGKSKWAADHARVLPYQGP